MPSEALVMPSRKSEIMFNPKNKYLLGKREEEGQGHRKYPVSVCMRALPILTCFSEKVQSSLPVLCIKSCRINKYLPTVRASKSLWIVPWSLTMPDSWTHFTNSSSCMYFVGSWNLFMAPSSCPFPRPAYSRSWSLLTRLISRLSSAFLSACREISTLWQRPLFIYLTVSKITHKPLRWTSFRLEGEVEAVDLPFFAPKVIIVKIICNHLLILWWETELLTWYLMLLTPHNLTEGSL